MNLTRIAKRSLQTLWTRKHLWFFGFFIAATGGGGGGGGAESGGAIGAGAPMPTWLLPLAVGLGLLGLVAIVLNVLSEAALIRGVRDDQEGEVLGVLAGLREGRRHFTTVLALKVLLAVGFAGTAVVVAAPLALGALSLTSWLASALLALPLVLVAVPVVLTLYFVYEYALRFAVLDDLTTRDAIRAARRHLHGRLGDSIHLTLLSFVGQVGGSLVTMALALPAAIVGLSLYFTVGLVPAIVAGVLLGVPAIVVARGATGTFRSSVWTIGFIEGRA